MEFLKNRIGEGNTAELFALDEHKVLKLFKHGYPQYVVEREYRNHLIVSEQLDNVPQVYEMTEADGRFGYVMELLKGTSIIEQMMSETTFVAAMERFAGIHKQWLTHKADSAVPAKQWMLQVIADRPDTESLREEILSLPDGDTLCHGDYHPFNVIITEDDRPYVIDFANVCRAAREYDIARTYALLSEAKDAQIGEIYLAYMEVSYQQISRFVDVIRQVRVHEMGENNN